MAEIEHVNSAADPIGHVGTANAAFVLRVGQTSPATLAPGDPVLPGDTLQTADGGGLGVVLDDGTVVALAGDGRMVLDEVIYDMGADTGRISLFLVKGLYVFVSGRIARMVPDAMTLNTPIGSIDIRGTQIGIDFSEPDALTVTMMKEEDGTVGEADVRNGAGVRVLVDEFESVTITAADEPPTETVKWDVLRLTGVFGETLGLLPTDVGVGAPNNYGFGATEFAAAAGAGAEEGVGFIHVTAGAGTGPTPVKPVGTSGGDFHVGPAEGLRHTPYGHNAEPLPVSHTGAPEGISPAAADPPNLAVTDVVGPEDTSIPLAISAALTDPSETLSVRISGIPAGAVLSAGIDNGDGSWTLTADQLDGLRLTPPSHSSQDFNFTVRAVSTEPSTGDTAETQDVVHVVVNAVADVPFLEAGDTAYAPDGLPGDQNLRGTSGGDTLIGGGGNDALTGLAGADVLYGDWAATGNGTIDVGLDVRAALIDTDASESLAVTIAGIPDGGILSAGIPNLDGTWTLNADDLDGLTLSLPDDFADDFSLDVTAIATDTDPDSGTVDTAEVNTSLSVAYIGGAPGDDVLKGGDGADQLYGGDGGDRLYGGADDDLLDGGGGGDLLDGGTGADTLLGGTGDDYLRGRGGADLLQGGDGMDTLVGDAGDDVLHGGGGPDVLQGGTGADTLTGDDGDDLLQGGGDPDALYGGDGADTLAGDGGDDQIYGDAGDDVLQGGSGADTLYGGGGDDRLEGSGGSDVLDGGSGADTLVGGSGSDTLVFRPGDGPGADRVEQFKVGDVLRFEGETFTHEDVRIIQSGHDAVVSVEGHDFDITLAQVDADKLVSYSVTEQPGSDVIVCFEKDLPD